MILSVSKTVSMLCLTIVELWLTQGGFGWIFWKISQSFFFIYSCGLFEKWPQYNNRNSLVLVQFVITFLFVGADLYGKWKLMQWLQLCSSRLLLSLTVHIVLILWLTALPRSLSLLSSAIFFWRACAVLNRGSGKSIFVMYAGPENRQLINNDLHVHSTIY